MYELLRSLSSRRLVLEQVPAATLSLAVAEVFFKFHSFLLECLAFLVTWFVIDAAGHLLRWVVGGRALRARPPS
jgi:hypothetical protein